jgi:hypothetical protein
VRPTQTPVRLSRDKKSSSYSGSLRRGNNGGAKLRPRGGGAAAAGGGGYASARLALPDIKMSSRQGATAIVGTSRSDPPPLPLLGDEAPPRGRRSHGSDEGRDGRRRSRKEADEGREGRRHSRREVSRGRSSRVEDQREDPDNDRDTRTRRQDERRHRESKTKVVSTSESVAKGGRANADGGGLDWNVTLPGGGNDGGGAVRDPGATSGGGRPKERGRGDRLAGGAGGGAGGSGDGGWGSDNGGAGHAARKKRSPRPTESVATAPHEERTHLGKARAHPPAQPQQSQAPRKARDTTRTAHGDVRNGGRGDVQKGGHRAARYSPESVSEMDLDDIESEIARMQAELGVV